MSNSSWAQPNASNFLQTAMDAPPATVAVAAGVLAVVVTSFLHVLRRGNKNAMPDLGWLPMTTAWPFFTHRFDFLQRGWKKTGQKVYQFWVMQHRVVAVSGDEARKTFFNDKRLGFGDGYRILLGGVPNIEDIHMEKEEDETAAIIRRTVTLLRRERLAIMVPTLFDDMHERMLEWGKEGQINPFREVYDLVFQMTVRMASCGELAKNRTDVDRLAKLYWTLDKSGTPAAVLFPWLPGRAKRDKEESTRGMYMMLHSYVERRRKATERNADAIDMLIEEGTDNTAIISFIMATIFAGVVNTGINSCWVLMYLAAFPEWKAKVKAEMLELFAEHASSVPETAPLHKRLGAIPVDAWDDGMPAIEACIRETLRIIQNSTMLRRSLSDDVKIEGHSMPKGSFLAYSMADMHLNPDVYPDPFKFDPGRYQAGREEDKKRPQAYLAWGVGRHPCAGMRVAKLEIKMIVALFLMGYEYELVDKSGRFPKKFPQPDRNDLTNAKPVGDPCCLKFKKTAE